MSKLEVPHHEFLLRSQGWQQGRWYLQCQNWLCSRFLLTTHWTGCVTEWLSMCWFRVLHHLFLGGLKIVVLGFWCMWLGSGAFFPLSRKWEKGTPVLNSTFLLRFVCSIVFKVRLWLLALNSLPLSLLILANKFGNLSTKYSPRLTDDVRTDYNNW